MKKWYVEITRFLSLLYLRTTFISINIKNLVRIKCPYGQYNKNIIDVSSLLKITTLIIMQYNIKY